MSHYSHPNNHNQKPEQTGATGAKVATGCGMGCLSVILVFLIGIVAVLWFAQTKVNQVAHKHSSEDPIEFVYPEIQLHELESILERFDVFRTAMANNNHDTDPLILSADDLNLVINNHKDFAPMAGKAMFEIEGEEFRAKVSLKPDDIPFKIWFLTKALKGRYINGRATLALHVAGSRSEMYLKDFNMGEVELPAPLIEILQKENLMNSLKSDPEIGQWFKMVGMKVQDGRLHIIPKKKMIEAIEEAAEAEEEVKKEEIEPKVEEAVPPAVEEEPISAEGDRAA